MTLLGPGGQPIAKEEGPQFVLSIGVTCPRCNQRIEATAKASGLSPVTLTQFYRTLINQVAQSFDPKVQEHDALHQSLAQGTLGATKAD